MAGSGVCPMPSRKGRSRVNNNYFFIYSNYMLQDPLSFGYIARYVAIFACHVRIIDICTPTQGGGQPRKHPTFIEIDLFNVRL